MKERKHPVHWPPIERGNRPVIIFLTVCTEKRKPILANDEVAGVILEAWLAADHWLVGRYILLPDHIHLFCAPGGPDALPVQKWVAFWKSHASRLAIPEAAADLADGLLGHAVAGGAELWRQVGLRKEQCRAAWVGHEGRGLALSRRVECPAMARSIMEGEAPSSP